MVSLVPSKDRSEGASGRDRAEGLLSAWRRALTGASRAAGESGARAARGWRRVLSGALGGIGRGAGTLAASLGEAILALARPSGLAIADRRVLRSHAVWGSAATLVGVGVALALSGTTAPAVAGAAWTVFWAFARRALLGLSAPAALTRTPRLWGVWGVGLLPFALAVTAELRLVALAASAFVTYRAAAGAGASRRQAAWMVGLAFGGQAAVEAASWVARAGTLLLLASLSG